MKKFLLTAVCIGAASTMLFACNSKNDAGEIELADYTQIEMPASEVNITDDDIDYYIQSFLEEFAESVEVTDRPAAEGDTVIIDYEGTMNGEAFEGGSATDCSLVLGSNTMIDGFESGIIGMNVGEKKVLNLTFPESYYSNTDFAGKPADFAITLKSITKTEIPELTDDFIAAHSEYLNDTSIKTVDQFKQYIKTTLEKQIISNYAFNYLLENSTIISYNEEGIAKFKDFLKEQQSYRCMSSYGVDLYTYLETVGMSEEEFDANLDEEARNYYQEKMIITEIANKEGLKVTDEDYEKAAPSFGYESYDAMKSEASEIELDIINLNILSEKVVDVLYNNTTLV